MHWGFAKESNQLCYCVKLLKPKTELVVVHAIPHKKWLTETILVYIEISQFAYDSNSYT